MTDSCSYSSDKEALTNRMKKILGQCRGIHRMIEEERHSLDVVQQLAAVSGAIDEVSLIVLKDHIAACATGVVGLRADDSRIVELIDAIRKIVRH